MSATVYVCPDCHGPRDRKAKRCRRCHANAIRDGRARRASVNPNPKVRGGWATRRGPSWTTTLTPAQIATVLSIRREHNGGDRKEKGSDGWRVYMVPSTLPARYLELRHYLTEGRVARWVIEQDGTVSADNSQGQLSELRAVT